MNEYAQLIKEVTIFLKDIGGPWAFAVLLLFALAGVFFLGIKKLDAVATKWVRGHISLLTTLKRESKRQTVESKKQTRHLGVIARSVRKLEDSQESEESTLGEHGELLREIRKKLNGGGAA